MQIGLGAQQLPDFLHACGRCGTAESCRVKLLSGAARGNGAPVLCSYFERAIRMAFSARAMRFVTISPTMRKLAGALFQTVVPILTVLGFCERSALTA
jgi:hypothetical protein